MSSNSASEDWGKRAENTPFKGMGEQISKLVGQSPVESTTPDTPKTDELREATRRSIARLISIQRGADTWSREDYITAGNIQIVYSRDSKRLINSEVHQALDSLQASSNMYEDRNFEKEPFYAVCKSDFESERNKYPLNKEES